MKHTATTRSQGDPRGEGGFTLIELLVASAMSVIIVGAAVSMLITAMKDQPKITSQADQVGQARNVSERMVTELRQGLKVESKEANKIVFLTYVHAASCTSAPSGSARAIECRVTYNCAASGVCTRSVLNPNGSGTARTATLVQGIVNPTTVFCYMPSTEGSGKCGTASSTEAPTYVGIKLRFAGTNTNAMTIEDGATLRNATLGY